METSEILAEAREKLVDQAVSELQQRRAHDGEESLEARRRHLAELYELVARCMRDDDVEPIVSSSQQFAADRFSAGFDIGEVQGEFNVLEEVLWGELAGTLRGEQRMEALERLSTVLGAARDALARTYVALSSETGAPAGTQEPAVTSDVVSVEIAGRVAVITLSDRRRRNAISAELARAVIGTLESLQGQDVRAVVLRAAAGMRVWSAGRDITELPRGRRDPLAYNDPLEELLRTIRVFPAPIVAMVHGSVWGGAFDLALSCDMIVADETASFAITPANLGLPYNTTGLLHFLGRLPINLIKEMFFTAEPVDAAKAKEWLVVNHLVKASELEGFTMELAAKMASKSPLAITVIKEQLRVLNDYQPIAAQVYERIQGLRRAAYDSNDYLEGLNAFAEKREPVFRGR